MVSKMPEELNCLVCNLQLQQTISDMESTYSTACVSNIDRPGNTDPPACHKLDPG